MSALNLRDFKKVIRVIREAKSIVKADGALEQLLREHNIGRPGAAGWALGANDRSRLRAVVTELNGLDPLTAHVDGSRMKLAEQGATDEKLARERPLAARVVCTALPGPITYAGELLAAIADVEYRLNVKRISVAAFDAVLSVENYEAFLAIHLLCWQSPGNTLVLYRGHDDSAKACNDLISAFLRAGKPVIYSRDADPSGIQMTLGSQATHALVPCASWRTADKKPGLWQRAADQLLRLPNILETVREDPALSPEYRSYASWVLSGRAFTEEGLLSQSVLMDVIPIRI